MDDAYETWFRQDKGCDTLWAQPLCAVCRDVLHTEGLMTGLEHRGRKRPVWQKALPNSHSLLQLCIFFFYSRLQETHSLIPFILSVSPDTPLYPWWNGVHADSSAAFFSKCDVKQGCNLKISSDLRTACPDTWAVHWLRWRRLSAVRERGCLKRLQGAAVPACQVCGRCCDQSVFIIAVWRFPRQSHDWLSRPEEDGLSLVPLAFCLASVSTFFFSLFCSNHYFMGSYCHRIYYSHNIILWCIFIFIYLYSVRPFG